MYGKPKAWNTNPFATFASRNIDLMDRSNISGQSICWNTTAHEFLFCFRP